MIKNLIFDFGDVFINLDKQGAMQNALNIFEIESLTDDMIATNNLYEQGLISTSEFVDYYVNCYPNLAKQDLIDLWNYILIEFPRYKLKFLQELSQSNNYNLILLSNTNELHIDWVKKHVSFYEDFKNCFDQFYLSHEIHLRKPDKEIFEFVINTNNLKVNETIFIDDTKENTDTAKQLGIHVWNIDETKEDIVNLFTIKKDLF